MKICICLNSAWNALNFRLGLIEAFIAEGHEVVVIAPPDEHASRLERPGCRFVSVKMDKQGASALNDALLVLNLYRVLRREKPQVLLGYTIKPNIYGSVAARLLGVPVINNVSGLGTAFMRGGWLMAVVRRLYVHAFSKSMTVFFQNPDDLALFCKLSLVRNEQAGLLPGSGVDLLRFSPPPPREPGDGQGMIFLLVARLLWDKGVGEYVEAARTIRERHPHARFQLLGFLDVENRTAIPRATVENWVAEGVVEYLGATDDVRPFLASADCVVLPSYREGTPRTLLEAAAMGRPLIATDVPGCREVVDEGLNGFLCTSKDPGSLANAMERIIRLTPADRSQMGQASRLKVEKQFDERIVIDRYLEAVSKILRDGYFRLSHSKKTQ